MEEYPSGCFHYIGDDERSFACFLLAFLFQREVVVACVENQIRCDSVPVYLENRIVQCFVEMDFVLAKPQTRISIRVDADIFVFMLCFETSVLEQESVGAFYARCQAIPHFSISKIL